MKSQPKIRPTADEENDLHIQSVLMADIGRASAIESKRKQHQLQKINSAIPDLMNTSKSTNATLPSQKRVVGRASGIPSFNQTVTRISNIRSSRVTSKAPTDEDCYETVEDAFRLPSDDTDSD